MIIYIHLSHNQIAQNQIFPFHFMSWFFKILKWFISKFKWGKYYQNLLNMCMTPSDCMYLHFMPVSIINKNCVLLLQSLKMLDEEEATDNELRGKFNQRWNRTPSGDLYKPLRAGTYTLPLAIYAFCRCFYLMRLKVSAHWVRNFRMRFFIFAILNIRNA